MSALTISVGQEGNQPVETGIRHLRNAARATPNSLNSRPHKLLIAAGNVRLQLPQDDGDVRVRGQVRQDVQLEQLDAGGVGGAHEEALQERREHAPAPAAGGRDRAQHDALHLGVRAQQPDQRLRRRRALGPGGAVVVQLRHGHDHGRVARLQQRPHGAQQQPVVGVQRGGRPVGRFRARIVEGAADRRVFSAVLPRALEEVMIFL